MSWLAGETKWWLILAALLGFVLTLVLQLVKVKVRDTRSTGGSLTGSVKDGIGGVGGKVAAGAAGVGAAGVAAGAAVKDRLDFDKPSFDKPTVAKPTFGEQEAAKAEVDLDKPTIDEPTIDKPTIDEPTLGTPEADLGKPAVDADLSTPSADLSEPDARTIIRPRGESRAFTDAAPAAAVPTAASVAASTPDGESRFGPGTVDALPNGTSPRPGYAIKGNADSMKFHTEDSPYYGRTKAEVWFESEDSARRAGFHRWDEKSPGGTHSR